MIAGSDPISHRRRGLGVIIGANGMTGADGTMIGVSAGISAMTAVTGLVVVDKPMAKTITVNLDFTYRDGKLTAAGTDNDGRSINAVAELGSIGFLGKFIGPKSGKTKLTVTISESEKPK